MTAEKSRSAADAREFVITRLIDAPRALVFKAWTDPEHLAKWWGPKGFTNPICDVDLRAGGAWRIVMRSPEGAEYPIKGVYREIAAPERLVLTDNWEDHPPEFLELLRKHGADSPATEALNTVTFEERGNKTLLTIRTRFDTAAVRDAMVKMGMNEGWSESLERLQALVAKG